MTAEKLKNMLDSGLTPIVKTKKFINDNCWLDKNMIGRVLSYTNLFENIGLNHYEFKIDVGSFEKINKKFMLKKYLNENNKKCLTYKGAGFIQTDIESVFMFPDDDLFVILEY